MSVGIHSTACADVAIGKTDALVRDLIIEQGAQHGLYGIKFFVGGRWVTMVRR